MNITDPIYTDENKAREHLESIQWPDGPACPHCGNCDKARITKLEGKSTRPGVYKCKECRKPFTATMGTIYGVGSDADESSPALRDRLIAYWRTGHLLYKAVSI